MVRFWSGAGLVDGGRMSEVIVLMGNIKKRNRLLYISLFVLFINKSK